MPDVPRVPAFKVGHPMPFSVLMKTGDRPFHIPENDALEKRQLPLALDPLLLPIIEHRAASE